MNYQRDSPPPIPPEVALRRLADQCTVQIPTGDIAGGSGFFIAPGLVATCAHVVAMFGTRQVSGRASVIWNGQSLGGSVRASPESGGTGGIWDRPDVCLIDLDELSVSHPYVALGPFSPIDDSRVYLGGYTANLDSQGFEFQGTSAWLGGPQGMGESLWRIVEVKLAPGMSGGPVLDLEVGVISAIVKAGPTESGETGGWVIPADAIMKAIPAYEQRINDARGQADEWNKIRATLTPDLPSEDLRRILVASADRMRLTSHDIRDLWHEVTSANGPVFDPRPSTVSMEHLIDELAQVISPQGELPPMGKLFKHMQRREEEWAGFVLASAGHSYAATRGLESEYESYEVPPQSTATRPVFVVRLDNRTVQHSDAQVELQIWRYPTGNYAESHPIVDPPSTYQIADMKAIEAKVTLTLAEHMNGLRADPRIEFVLPDRLLDEPVENWAIGKAGSLLLGERYPVVTRMLARNSMEQTALHHKAGEFKSGALPLAHEKAIWTRHWVCCGDNRTQGDLSRVLLKEGNPPFLAMTSWHPGLVPIAVDAARESGAPVLLWKHGHNLQPAGSCGCSAFRDHVTTRLAGTPFTQLPHEVWQARLELPGPGDHADHPGSGIAILWEDPARCPWEDAAKPQAPAEADPKLYQKETA